MSLSKVRTALVLTLAVGATAWFVGRAQESALVVLPFYAEKTITSFAPGGMYGSAKLQRYAIRSDGSQVLIMTQPDPLGQPKTEKTLWDARTSVRISADDRTESYVTFPMKGMAHTLGHRSERCRNLPTSGDRILGYEVVRLEEEFDIPSETGGRFKTVEYLAPQLNCYTLKEEAYKSTGEQPLALFEVKEVVTVTEGEPAASLFELPVGYTERTPLEMLAEFGRRYPDHAMSPEKLEKLRHLDDAHRLANSGR